MATRSVPGAPSSTPLDPCGTLRWLPWHPKVLHGIPWHPIASPRHPMASPWHPIASPRHPMAPYGIPTAPQLSPAPLPPHPWVPGWAPRPVPGPPQPAPLPLQHGVTPQDSETSPLLHGRDMRGLPAPPRKRGDRCKKGGAGAAGLGGSSRPPGETHGRDPAVGGEHCAGGCQHGDTRFGAKPPQLVLPRGGKAKRGERGWHRVVGWLARHGMRWHGTV